MRDLLTQGAQPRAEVALVGFQGRQHPVGARAPVLGRALAHAAHRFAIFYDGESRGTPHLVECVRDLEKPCDVFGPRSEP